MTGELLRTAQHPVQVTERRPRRSVAMRLRTSLDPVYSIYRISPNGRAWKRRLLPWPRQSSRKVQSDA